MHVPVYICMYINWYMSCTCGSVCMHSICGCIHGIFSTAILQQELDDEKWVLIEDSEVFNTVPFKQKVHA